MAGGQITKSEEILGVAADVMWQPRWTVDIGNNCQMGLTIDDGCLVPLVLTYDEQWIPTHHLPEALVSFIKDMVEGFGN